MEVEVCGSVQFCCNHTSIGGNAYKKATIETFGSDVEAAVYIDAREQINDHLWGHGYVAPDEYPDDNYVYHYHWGCE